MANTLQLGSNDGCAWLGLRNRLVSARLMLLIKFMPSNSVGRAEAMLGRVRMTQGLKKIAIVSLVRYPERSPCNEGALGTKRSTPALDRRFLLRSISSPRAW
jgi:hypothetical protein